MLMKKCIAPAPYGAGRFGTQCGQEFAPTCDHQLYCSMSCSKRAHAKARKENHKLKRLGLQASRPPGFPDELRSATAREANTIEGPSLSAIANEVHRLEELDRLTAEAQSASILEKMGYLRPGATTGVEPTRGAEPTTHPRAEPDRSAEPQQHGPIGPMSTEDEAPDFRSCIHDADAPLDYPETEDL